MALITCNFFADVLGLSTSMTVILPQATTSQIGMRGAASRERHPTLYLLHGLSDDHTIWLRRTSIERYVAPLGLAVVMPQVHRSFYADEVHGMRFWTFLSQELPAVAGSFFPLSAAREDTFVAGLSMGGYGAYKWALRHPERFAAAASLSGALDVAALQSRNGLADDPVNQAFGGRPVAGTPDDLLWLVDRAAAHGTDLPAFYLACGNEDFLVEDNHTFVAAAAAAGIPLNSRFTPGTHDWDYWDDAIQDVLAWLPLSPPE